MDPARIIPLYSLTSLQQERAARDGATTYHSYLSNDKLFARASDGQSMDASGLIPHRATDDARAERTWLTKLPEFVAIMYGTSAKPCNTSLELLRTYCEQYERNVALEAEIATARAAEAVPVEDDAV